MILGDVRSLAGSKVGGHKKDHQHDQKKAASYLAFGISLLL